MSAPDWGWSDDEEHWTHDRFGFVSREEAIRAAEAELSELDPDAQIWTGRRREIELTCYTVDPEIALESCSETLFELLGEGPAREWPGKASPEALAELGDGLTQVLHAWLRKHDPPQHFLVEDVEDHEIPLASGSGASS